MKLNAPQSAPLFSKHDIYGTKLDLHQFKGQKIYLAFERNAGCPVCNLRMHQLLKQSDVLTSHGMKMIFVYESPVETMKDYLGDNTYPFHFVADPKNILYNMYGVERSFLKVLQSMFNGIMTKVKEGTKLFRKPMKQDGHVDRIPAEFIIDENGKIKLTHYGRFVGDHLSLELLKKSL